MRNIALAYTCGIALLVATGTVVTIFGAKTDTVVKQKQDGLVALPQFDYVNEYGKPYNVVITCTHRGFPANLDPNGQPKPGQTLVRKCVVTRKGKESS